MLGERNQWWDTVRVTNRFFNYTVLIKFERRDQQAPPWYDTIILGKLVVRSGGARQGKKFSTLSLVSQEGETGKKNRLA